MKPNFQLILIFTFTLLTHYFVLNFFGMDYQQNLKAVVIGSQIKGKGLYRRAEIVVNVNHIHNGKAHIEKKTFSTWDKLVKDLKPGKEYIMQTRADWLLTYKVTSL